MPDASILFVSALLVVLLNIPFGYWRAGVKRYKLQWFLAIHIPVLIIISARIISGLGWHWSSFVVSATSFFLGQFLGGRLHKTIIIPNKAKRK